MRILHAYCLNHNIGDYFLGMGLKNLLREHLAVDFIAETNLQGQVFDEYYIRNVVNKKFDLLVIGGGGIIHGAHWPNGWFWLIDEELIDLIEIPFIVYAAGYNYFKDEGGIPDIGRRHLKRTVEKAAFFSVRNDGSAERFRGDMGFDVPEIPDPGFHIDQARTFICPESEPFVLIQLADDKPQYRYASAAARTDFIRDMRRATEHLALDRKVIFSPHVLDDVRISLEVSDGINNTSVWDFSRFAFDRCAECVGYYQRADFVLSMRGHGQIVPMAFQTPVISLENHPKHAGLMERLGLGSYNVSLAAPEFFLTLMDKLELLASTRGDYQARLKDIHGSLDRQSAEALRRLKSNLPAPRFEVDTGKA
jgi:polysaccharide pyruvyl transferase WcaK-like protein